MRKTARLLLALPLICAALTGCGEEKAPEPALAVYSFCGENEYLSLSNGVIVLTPSENTLYGGNLSASNGCFDGIVSYSATFYLEPDREKNVLMSNTAQDQTGGTLSLPASLGQLSSDALLPASVDADWPSRLAFSLQTVDRSGKESEYRLPLTVTRIVGAPESPSAARSDG